MIQIEVQISEEQAQLLEQLAAALRVPKEELSRQVIARWLEAEAPAPVSDEVRARAAIGRFHTGGADVSERHDEYLADAYAT